MSRVTSYENLKASSLGIVVAQMSPSSQWVAWVGPARKGDAKAIDKLAQCFSPFVHAVLLSRLSHLSATALVRSVLDQTLRKGSLPNETSFASWLLAAARERAFEAAKLPAALVDLPGADPMVNNAHLVLARIRPFPEATRERLVMRLVEGLSGPEIAQWVGGKEADVRSELERAAAMLVQGLTGQAVSFVGDNYLWSLAGTPHSALAPLENQLTSLRYDSHPDSEMTPSHLPALVAPRRGPEGRQQTGAANKAFEAEALFGEEDEDVQTLANPMPPAEPLIKAPAVAVDPANPFGTSVKTIHVSDLPAAADFADLKQIIPDPAEPWGAMVEEASRSTQLQSIAEVSIRTRLAPPDPDETRVGSPAPRAPIQSPPAGVDDSLTAINASPPGAWRASHLVGNPGTAKTVMGMPAIIVARGSVTRSWRPFGIAGVLALLAVAVGMLLLDGTNRRIRSGWNLVPVVVAATDLTEGTLITLEMISQRSVPENFVTASVIRPDSTTYVVNQKILVDVQAGDPLLWSQFEVARTNERLSKKVMRRARAYDLMTTKSIAVGGWVQPNDRIDIIASIQASGTKGERVALTLLQDVPVLTTGKITSSMPSLAKKDGDKDYIDVSVLLLPEEAELVALATDIGELQFTLRTDDDHETLVDHRGTSSRTLLQGERVRLLQMKRMRTVQLIRNSRPP